MNLQNWINLGREHWKEFLPKKFAALKKAGMLEAALKEAAEQTYLATSALEEQGMQPDYAWQMAREKYLLLPPEDRADEPTASSAAFEVMKMMVQMNQEMAADDYSTDE
jgi:hypothetical protein